MTKIIFIIGHSSGLEGPVDYFSYFLLNQGHKVIKLMHPLDIYEGQDTFLEINEKEIIRHKRRELSNLNLFFDFLYSFYYLYKYPADTIVGANNFDTFSAIVAARMWKRTSTKVIYFGSDYSEKRFNSSIMNFFYQWVEKIAIKRSDLVISNTKRAEKERLRLGLDQEKSLIIPNGVSLDEPPLVKQIDKHQFIYVGSVTKEHGLYEMIQTIFPLIKKLVLIGDGNDWNRVIQLCVNLEINLETYHHRSHDFVLKYLHGFNGIGLAPYNTSSRWTHYSSPLKINEYLSSGIPVVVSNVPEISKLIEECKLGIVYNQLDLEEIGEAINKFDVKEFDKRASKFYESFRSDKLFKKIQV